MSKIMVEEGDTTRWFSVDIGDKSYSVRETYHANPDDTDFEVTDDEGNDNIPEDIRGICVKAVNIGVYGKELELS